MTPVISLGNSAANWIAIAPPSPWPYKMSYEIFYLFHTSKTYSMTVYHQVLVFFLYHENNHVAEASSKLKWTNGGNK
jgi:hypothetical protein